MAEQRQLVDEQDALMRFVDRPGDDPIVRLRAELRMAAVRIVTDVPEQFRLACAGREDERPPGDRYEDLSRALLLDLAALLERLLVEHADHVARPLVDDDLFLPELLARRRHAIPALELRKRDFEDAAEEVAERIADIRLGRRLRSPALRAHAIRWRRVRAAVDALVSEPLRDVDGRLLADDPFHRIVWDRDLRGRLEVVEGEPLISGEHLRSCDRLHPDLRREIAARPDLDAGWLFRDRPHLRADD